MTQVIIVTPSEGGWRVHSQSLAIDQQFRSGAKAEAIAKAVAGGLAAEGVPTEIHIFLRDGTQGGRFICRPGQRSPRPVLESALGLTAQRAASYHASGDQPGPGATNDDFA